MYVKKPFIIPQILFPGTFLAIEDGDQATEVMSLLMLMEKGFQSSAFSLSKFLLAQDNFKKEYSSYHEQVRNLQNESWKNNYSISDDYRKKHNVFTEDDLPWEIRKEIYFKKDLFKIENGVPPYSYVHNEVFYYANNFAIGIDQIVLALKKLKEYPKSFLNESLYDQQMVDLNKLTGSKDIRDSIAHQEDRVRQKTRGKKIIGDSESFGLIEGEPTGVFFNSCLIGSNQLTYTNHEGEHKQMEISIPFFQKVEQSVQKIIENIGYRYNQPRMMMI